MYLPHQGTTSAPKTIALTSDIPDSSKFMTTDTDQTITGRKNFITLKAVYITDGTTTKPMTEVLTGYTTEQRVQEMIDTSIGTAIGGTY